MAQNLEGKRVRIEAVKGVGSTRKLNGLTGLVLSKHDLAPGWVKVLLDKNKITEHRVWSVPVDVLVRLDEEDG